MCQENGEGERGRGEAGKDGGVERTHREARSHDLMNELAWLLASVVGCTRSPCSAVFPQPRRERERERERWGGRGEGAMNGQGMNFERRLRGVKNPGSTQIEQESMSRLNKKKKERNWTDKNEGEQSLIFIRKVRESNPLFLFEK